MTEAENLAQKLEGMATIGDMGRKPDAKDVRRQAAKELRRQADEIKRMQSTIDKFITSVSLDRIDWEDWPKDSLKAFEELVLCKS